jgi:hypothetical protein
VVQVERTGPTSDGLTKLFWLFIRNRDSNNSRFTMSALVTSWIGCWLNFVRYRLSMDNSLAGSRSNIQAHYDIGNDLYTLFLDQGLMMYSSAIYDVTLDAQKRLCFRDSLEDAQYRKVRAGPGGGRHRGVGES